MATAAAELIGQSLGPYTITARLGGGGMAEIYRATHRNLRVDRALKIIRPELGQSEDFRARFLQEAQAVASLRHPNIVQVHDFGVEQNVCFMVMEFIEGSDLKKLMLRETRIRPIRRAVEMLLQIADALQYAHSRGVIHRDIKPENIMISTTAQPILTDFGIARLMRDGTRLTQTGAAIGTPAYMAPEQALGTEDIGPATDIYALCVALYEMLTGRVPFTAPTPVALVMKTIRDPLPMPQTLCPDIGDAVQKVIVKGTAKRPEERYDSMADLQKALRNALDRDRASEQPTLARALTAPIATIVSRPRAENRAAMIAASIAAVAAVGGVGYWMSLDRTVPVASESSVLAAPPIRPDPLTAEQIAANLAHERRERQPAVVESPPVLSKTETTTLRTDSSPPGPEPAVIARTTKPASRDEENPVSAVAADPIPAKADPAAPAAATPIVASVANPASGSAAASATTGSTDEVQRGVTTQMDLLKRFGGPNLTTYDEAGLETWIYERSTTRTDVRANSQSAQGTAQLGLFFSSFSAGGSVEAGRSSDSLQSSTSIRSITVIVKFSPERKVADYSVKTTGFQ